MTSSPQIPKFTIATRIHLGNASTPPPQEKIQQNITAFLTLAASSNATRAAIAIDPSPRIPGYSLPSAIKTAITTAQQNNDDITIPIDVLEVSPWGQFLPALNALLSWGCRQQQQPTTTPPLLLLLSAETTLTPTSVSDLLSHVCENTLVAGAALPGHDYTAGMTSVSLNGRTCPWNTAAVWNLNKIGLIGFPMVAEGVIKNDDGSPGAGGVEEASAIAILQKILPKGSADAKLVKLPGVEWEQTWNDEGRQKWHNSKMESKITRAKRHLDLLGLEGTVIHC